MALADNHADAAASLRAILELIDDGDLEATAAERAYLDGATGVFEQTSYGKRPFTVKWGHDQPPPEALPSTR